MPNKKITFDAATFADAVQKASKVAPNKGAAYDKAAGILIERKALGRLTMKATNLDTSYFQNLHTIEDNAAEVSWRVPSALLAGLVSQLPLSSGNTITLIDPGDGMLRISSGSVKVRLALIVGEFPHIEEFDTSTLSAAHDFAAKAVQVAWACGKDGVYSGVRVDGQYLIGASHEAAALVPCEVPLESPVTVPLWNIASILKSASDVRLSAAERELRIMLDADAQATSRLIEGEYPNVHQLNRDNYVGTVAFPKSAVLDAINRLLVVGRNERLPRVAMTLHPGPPKLMTFDMQVEQDRIQDSVEITGEIAERFEILFSAQKLVNAIENTKDEIVNLSYGAPGNPNSSMMPVKISDSKGYVALVMPRKP